MAQASILIVTQEISEPLERQDRIQEICFHPHSQHHKSQGIFILKQKQRQEIQTGQSICCLLVI